MSEIILPNTFKILSFDPGLTCTGWTLCEYTVATGNIKVLKMGSIYAVKLASVVAQRNLVNQYGKRLVTLQILKPQIHKLVKSCKPDFIVAEDAFCHPKRITAYEALLQWHTVVGELMYTEFNMPVYRLAPRHIKRVLTGDGTSGKVNIQKAILTNPRIDFKSNLSLSNINEHEADSVAIGYAFVRTILPGIIGSECFDKFGITLVKKNKKK